MEGHRHNKESLLKDGSFGDFSFGVRDPNLQFSI